MNRAAVRCVARSLAASMLFIHSTIQRMTYTTDNANNSINKGNNNDNANTSQQHHNDNINSVGNDGKNFAEASTQASFINDNYYYNNNNINGDKGNINNMYGDHTINYGKYYGNDDINNRYSANNGEMLSGNDDGTSDVYYKLSDRYEELIREHRPLIRKVAIVILFVTCLMIVIYMTSTGAYFVKEVQNKRKDKKEEEQDEDNKYSSNIKKEKVIGGKPLVFPLDMNTVVNTTDRDVNVNGRTRLAAPDASSR